MLDSRYSSCSPTDTGKKRAIIAAAVFVCLISSFAERCCSGQELGQIPLEPIVVDTAETYLPLPSQSFSDSVAPPEDDIRLGNIEQQLRDLTSQVAQQVPVEEADSDDGIKIGGAVRFQYSFEDYVQGNRQRGGDVDFDIFRIDLNGEIGDVMLSAQYRWFQYMNVIHHAWVGYQCNDEWQVQAGITRVPFGNLDFNSNSYFFSSNYYIGLEDDYDAGIKLIGTDDRHDLRLAFFKTDEMGGIDGYVDNRSDRYSYDVVGVRNAGEGIYDAPVTLIAENNTASMRYAYKFPDTEFGASCLFGDISSPTGSAGHRWAYAVHSTTTIDRWNVMFQFTDYCYDVDDAGLLVVGAYSFFDTIPAKAQVYTGNVAYKLPVDCGPVTSLTFYNDLSVLTGKSGGLTQNSVMNVTGVAVAAGGLYTYFDLVSAKNHPFIGGSLGNDAGDWNTRFNVNVGFYF